jgi:hypothetical protein
MSRSHIIRLGFALACLGILFARNAGAFYYPLQQTQIREAYLFGHSGDPQKVAALLEPYTRRFPLPSTGPRVETIDFQTPYEQVILRSRERTNDYDLDQAEKDYQAQPDLVLIRVVVYSLLTRPASAARPSDGQQITDDDWLGFHFLVSQEHPLEPKKMRGKNLYAGRYDKGARKEILMESAASQFRPGVAKILVTSPEGQGTAAEFDLGALK